MKVYNQKAIIISDSSYNSNLKIRELVVDNKYFLLIISILN